MHISSGQKLSFAAMVTALGLVVLYASGMIGIAGYALVTLASVFLYILTCEGLYGLAAVCFVVTSGISLLIAPEKLPVLLYIGLFGHFPLYKSYVDNAYKNIVVRFCMKLLYCNVFLVVGLCIAIFGFHVSLSFVTLPKWLVVLAVQLAFFVVDLVHSFCRWLYVEKLRVSKR